MSARRTDLNRSFVRASDCFGESLPKIQPSLPGFLLPEEIITIYKADALLVMPKLREIAIFLMREARSDYEILVDPIETGILTVGQYHPGEIKKDDRIRKKAEREKRDTDGKPRYDDIRDYGRSRTNVNNPNEAAAMCEVVEWAEYAEVELPYGARVIDVENRFAKPTPSGYRSLKANIAIPIIDGARPYHIVELQVQHRGFEIEIEQMRKNRFHRNSHEAYEGGREMEERFWTEEAFWKSNNSSGTTQLSYDVAKRYGEMIRVCKEIHGKSAQKFGLNNINFDPFFKRRMGMALEEKLHCDRPDLN